MSPQVERMKLEVVGTTRDDVHLASERLGAACLGCAERRDAAR